MLKRRLTQIIFLNLFGAILFGGGYLLSRINFPYLQIIVSFFLFLLPGANISWILECLSHQEFGLGKFSLFSIISASIFPGLVSYILSIKNQAQFNENIFLVAFAILLSVTFIGAVSAVLITKFPITEINLTKIIKSNRTLWLVILAIIIFQLINFLIYRYIPEGDSYKYLVKFNQIMREGKIIPDLDRPLFYFQLASFHYLSKIPLYWIFKIVIPLYVSTIFIPFFLLAKEVTRSKLLIFCAALLPFSIPVVSQEILISRPQSFFIVFFVYFLFLASEYLREKNLKTVYLYLFFLFFSALGLKIHEFFAFSFLLSLIALVILLWSTIKKYPLETVLVVLFLVAGIYPWLQTFGITDKFGALYQNIQPLIKGLRLDLWFIDNYKTIDGFQVGWPGYSSILFYIYNIGFSIPAIFLLILLSKRRSLARHKTILLYSTSLILFFTIAEILPRLGIAYFPERTWLFLIISGALLTIFVFNRIAQKPKLILIWIVLLVLFLSLSVSWGITYAKGGWITPQEEGVLNFIKYEIPQNSVFITQPANYTLIDYFANRLSTIPPQDFFFSDDRDKDRQFVANLPEYISRKNWQKNILENSSNSLRVYLDQYLFSEDKGERTSVRKKINNEEEIFEKSAEAISRINKYQLDQERPVYILYSFNLFNYLYSNREWWKLLNFYNANLNKFDNNPNDYEKLFDQDGVLIWKVKK